MPNSERARLAIDIGGTFTDVVLQLANGRRITTKRLTTHGEPGRAVLDGIAAVMQDADCVASDVGLIIHGTTLATNALIERRGAATALLVTEGHRDALEMAHEDRFEQYDVMIDRPAPLVPRHLRLPVRERLDARGNVLVPLAMESVAAAVATAVAEGVQSVVVGYLHGYVNPRHEQQTAQYIEQHYPQLSLTLASQVCPEIREFERLSTACANAYVRPLMARYLHQLDDDLKGRGFACPFLLMTSGGGLTTLQTAARFPIRLVESGPAGGAILAASVARMKGFDRLLSFDMGGTTAKLCLIDDYRPLHSRSFEVDRVYRFKKGSGLPVRIPVIEMVEIGAGGGSIARIDALQRIQVGPDSAGSEPGPAAYGRGGGQPTVTDADVVMGRVVADRFAGGAFVLDAAAASQVLVRGIAEPAGLASELAAFAISEVVDENMAAAARAHAAEFGMDLASRDLVAFGGAAPLHAARLADKLGVDRIVVPTEAGVGSAVGFLLAPVSYEVVRSRFRRLDQFDAAEANALMDEMRAEATAVVQAGAPGQPLTEARQAYMRYAGQGHEIAVDLPVERFSAEHGSVLRRAFEHVYARLYGRCIEGVEIEILSWTLSVSAPATARPALRGAATGASTDPEPLARQPMFDPVLGRPVDVPVYLRERLAAGTSIVGPALIAEDQTTTVVTSSFAAEVDDSGYLVLVRRKS